MLITFNCWSADEIVRSFLNFAGNVNIDYKSNKYGFKETMQGWLEKGDFRLSNLPELLKVETRHELQLKADWRINFRLHLVKDPGQDFQDKVQLEFDNNLYKQVQKHFRDFEPVQLDGPI